MIDNGVHGFHGYPSVEPPWLGCAFGLGYSKCCVAFSTRGKYVLFSTGMYGVLKFKSLGL